MKRRGIVLGFVAVISVLLLGGSAAFGEYRIANITTETGPYASIGVSNTEGVKHSVQPH